MLYHLEVKVTNVPVLEVTRQFQVNKKSQVQILWRQFPLRPTAAKTIYHCQGDTLIEAVDFPASTREHMHYVGLSHVRNSSALHILNWNEIKIKVKRIILAPKFLVGEHDIITGILFLINPFQKSKK